MKFDAKRIAIQVATILLALPLLYVASSGPALRFHYRQKDRFVPVEGFYAPMFSGAKTLHLLLPVGLYLRAWGVIVGINSFDGRMLIVSEDYMHKMQEQPAPATPSPAPTATPAP